MLSPHEQHHHHFFLYWSQVKLSSSWVASNYIWQNFTGTSTLLLSSYTHIGMPGSTAAITRTITSSSSYNLSSSSSSCITHNVDGRVNAVNYATLIPKALAERCTVIHVQIPAPSYTSALAPVTECISNAGEYVWVSVLAFNSILKFQRQNVGAGYPKFHATSQLLLAPVCRTGTPQFACHDYTGTPRVDGAWKCVMPLNRQLHCVDNEDHFGLIIPSTHWCLPACYSRAMQNICVRMVILV